MHIQGAMHMKAMNNHITAHYSRYKKENQIEEAKK